MKVGTKVLIKGKYSITKSEIVREDEDYWYTNNYQFGKSNLILFGEENDCCPTKIIKIKEYKKCLYCDKEEPQESLHFQCPICGNGMCDECYDKDIGTEEQCFDIDEMELPEDLYKELFNKSKGRTQLICFNCVEKTQKEIKKLRRNENA